MLWPATLVPDQPESGTAHMVLFVSGVRKWHREKSRLGRSCVKNPCVQGRERGLRLVAADLAPAQPLPPR
jgi:hypothetical protein